MENKKKIIYAVFMCLKVAAQKLMFFTGVKNVELSKPFSAKSGNGVLAPFKEQSILSSFYSVRSRTTQSAVSRAY